MCGRAGTAHLCVTCSAEQVEPPRGLGVLGAGEAPPGQPEAGITLPPACYTYHAAGSVRQSHAAV